MIIRNLASMVGLTAENFSTLVAMQDWHVHMQKLLEFGKTLH